MSFISSVSLIFSPFFLLGVLRVWEASTARCVYTQTLPSTLPSASEEDENDNPRSLTYLFHLPPQLDWPQSLQSTTYCCISCLLSPHSSKWVLGSRLSGLLRSNTYMTSHYSFKHLLVVSFSYFYIHIKNKSFFMELFVSLVHRKREVKKNLTKIIKYIITSYVIVILNIGIISEGSLCFYFLLFCVSAY